MKKLLILAYDFPPYVSVGGLRPYAWYKYLKDYDVYPIVVTRQWGNKYGNELDYIAPGESKETIIEETEYGTIIRTPYKPNWANRIMLKYGKSKFALLRKMITAWYEFMQFLFFVGPKSGLYRGAKEYLRHNKVDAIIATGEPFILFKYASALSGKFNIPWIADYRDPWVENKNRSRMMGKWNAHFERKFLRNAICATTVDEFFKMQISTNVKTPFRIIPNGYNPETMDSVAAIEQSSDVLRLAFVGTIYNWHPIESVLDGFSRFVQKYDSPKIELNFFGINNAEYYKEHIKEHCPNLLDYVNIHPRMQNDMLLKELAKHNVMLLFNYYSFTGTKIYDYLGIRRKIILCYSNDAEALELKRLYYPTAEIEGLSTHLQEDLINETNSGVVVRDKQHLIEVLEDLYEEFLANGSIACESKGYERYSRREQTGKVAEIVKAMRS